VHPAAWPDSREFLALETEVVGRRAHIEGIIPPIASAVPCIFGCAANGPILCRHHSSTFSVPPRKTRLDKMISMRARNGFTYYYRQANGGQFCPAALANIRCGFRGNRVRADEDNFVHAPTVLWHAGIVVVTGEGSQRRYLA
jgi:hypothetical protein